MAVFKMYYKLRFSDATVRRYERDMGDFTSATPYDDALSAATQIATSFQPLTNCVLAEYGISHVIASDATLPNIGDGEAKQSDVALVVCHLEDDAITGNPDETFILAIPAPEQALFQGNSGRNFNTIDPTNADLVQHVQQLAQHADVSDGENIDLNKGPYSNGISHGYRKGTKKR